MIFEAFLRGGGVIEGDNWTEVPAQQVEALIVHHPWQPGISMVVSGPGEPFLWKEAIGTPAQGSRMTAVGFGRTSGEGKLTIRFNSDGTVEGHDE